MPQEVTEAWLGSREQRLQIRIDPRHLRYESQISASTARPSLVEPGGGPLSAGVKPQYGTRPGDFIYVFDPAHGDTFRQIQSQGIESPLEPGTVQEDVRPGIECKAIHPEFRGKPSGLGPSLHYQHIEASTGQTE